MHQTGECFSGPLRGRKLRRLPTGRHTRWLDWRTLHPDTDVLRPDPRFLPGSGREGYFPRLGARSGNPWLPPEFPGTIDLRDPRLAGNALVYGRRPGKVTYGGGRDS